MASIHNLGTEPMAWFFVATLMGTCSALYGKQAFAWLLLKLYKLFFTGRHHLSDI